jgi:hypothetical protein
VFKYEPPASIDDLAGRPTRAGFLDAWHAFIASRFAAEQSGPGVSLFFSETASPATSAEIPVAWDAFPKFISRLFPNDAKKRWDRANELDTSEVEGPFRQQDEYCEWFAYRDSPAGPIRRIVFTAEAPEYWERLAVADFARVVQLYRQLVSPLVQPNELLAGGEYNPRNKWNTTHGVIHLTHGANTLGAEINLAARATVMRKDTLGARIVDTRKFACSSNFGDVDRSSDPSIGSAVNLTALPPAAGSSAKSITLANPVGLYIDTLKSNVLTDMDGNPLTGWFTFVRGKPGRGLMAVLAPPDGATFGLDKVLVNGLALTHGGQVAEHIKMVLYAKTANLGQPTPALRSAVAHCCAPSGFDPGTLSQLNIDHVGAGFACGTGRTEAYPNLVGPSGPGFAPEDVDSPGFATEIAPPSVSRFYRARRGR